MAKELLLEIGVEEIPSGYMSRAIADLKKLARQKLAEARLDCGEVLCYGTPRRFTLLVKEVSEQQEESIIENRGPKKSIAFDDEGNPSKAGLGFARGQGVDFADLEIREVGGIEYIFAVKKETAHPAEEILSPLLLNLINSIPFPKSMRWGYYQTRFARPIRWLLAMFGDKKMELNIENITSANFTYGHRFLSAGQLQISSIDNYFQVLKDNYVILDQEERKKLIWQQVLAVAEKAGGKPMENEELLEEIAFLVEYPTAFFGEFSSSYLNVPPEVLTTSMIEHQRYFPVFEQEGKLMPGFIGVRNGTDYSIELVKAGNERVLKARLEDALFFWNEDTKKPLAEMAINLKNVLFHERLGTIMDKVERLQKLSVFIGQESNLSNGETLNKAAYLCKADLLSNMVYEFPELQGIMGRYYASKSGEEPEVSAAIFEHYLPRFAGDILPSAAAGKVLSLTEKLDNLVGCFCIGIKPTGSQDPYALRRQALGIVNIILDNKLSLDLRVILEQAYNGFAAIKPELNSEETIADVMDFISQRMRGVLAEQEITYDVIDAVLSVPSADLNDVCTRAGNVQAFKHSAKFEDFMVVYNRANNLSKKWDSEDIDEKVLVDASEIQLYKSLVTMKNNMNQVLADKDYLQALDLLAGLRIDVDNFFNAVMVMVEDEQLKAARLGIIKNIANKCNEIADFSKIV